MNPCRSGTATYRDDGTCNFCGSLDSDILMRLLEEGKATLGPTDKNYKVYVDMPEEKPDELRVISRTHEKERPSWGGDWKQWSGGNTIYDGWDMRDGDWYLEEPRGPIRHEKFYFEHMTETQQIRFVELYNEKKLKIGYPGYFYRMPFFMKYVDQK